MLHAQFYVSHRKICMQLVNNGILFALCTNSRVGVAPRAAVTKEANDATKGTPIAETSQETPVAKKIVRGDTSDAELSRLPGHGGCDRRRN